MQIQPQTEPRRSRPEVISLVFFCVALTGFQAQAVVSTYLSAVEKLTRAPLQVLSIWIAAGVLAMHPGTTRWLLVGRGREPLFIGLFALCTVVVYWDVNGPLQAIKPFQRSIQLATGLALYCVTFLLMRRESNIRFVLQLWFLLVSISASVSILEFVTGVSVPWSIYYGGSGGSAGGGLENTPVSYSYGVAAPIAFASTFALSRARPYADPGQMLSLVTLVLGVGGTLTAASRSGLLGVVAGTGVGFLLLGRHRRSLPLIVIGSIGGLIVVASGIQKFIQKGGVASDSRMSDTWLAYFPIALANPFGVGDVATISAKLGLLRQAETLLSIKVDPSVATNAFAIAPHNAWLTAGVQFGWVGMLSLFGIYALVLIRCYSVLRHPRLEPGEKVILAGLSAAVVSVLLHSSFHNASILLGEMRGFLLLGLITTMSISLGERAATRTREIRSPFESPDSQDDESHSWHPRDPRPQSP